MKLSLRAAAFCERLLQPAKRARWLRKDKPKIEIPSRDFVKTVSEVDKENQTAKMWIMV
jgi:Asp-tRNA(Asn)/Glu-tRNA(Gln) amidotransferase C subunit